MKAPLLTAFLGCFCMTLFAQQQELDSLKTLVLTHPREDTVRLKWLLRISALWSNVNPDSGMAVADEAIRLATQLNNQPKLSTAYNNKGINEESAGNASLAIFWYTKALENYKTLKDTVGIAIEYHNIGIDHFNLTKYDTAMNDQQQALALFRRLNHNPGIAASLNSIGVIYLYTSNYPLALENYMAALKLNEQMKAESEIAMGYLNVGLVYGHMPDPKKALEYQFKALAIYRRIGNLYGQQQVLGNCGNFFDNLQQPDSAIRYYLQAVDISRKGNFRWGEGSALVNLATVSNRIGRFTDGLHYAQQALTIFQQDSSQLGAEDAYNQLGAAFVGLGKTAQAIGFFQHAAAIGETTHTLNIESDAWLGLSEAYKHERQYASALKAYQRYANIQDSIANDSTRQAITRQEIQYASDKKQDSLQAIQRTQAALASAEIARQKLVRNTVAAGAVLLLVSAAIVFVFYNRRRQAEFRARVADTEMKALRAQMNPHFIFNSLNSIGYYMTKHDLTAAETYLTSFAKLMRSILENSEQKEISLAQDLRALELYLQLERSRLEGKFNYRIEIASDIDAENTLVPPLLLQPFVENSIWHGIMHMAGIGEILIRIDREDESLRCIVEDDGIGLAATAVTPSAAAPRSKEGSSLGMKITQSRLEILDKGRGRMRLIPLTQGTRAEVILPLSLRF